MPRSTQLYVASMKCSLSKAEYRLRQTVYWTSVNSHQMWQQTRRLERKILIDSPAMSGDVIFMIFRS